MQGCGGGSWRAEGGAAGAAGALPTSFLGVGLLHTAQILLPASALIKIVLTVQPLCIVPDSMRKGVPEYGLLA